MGINFPNAPTVGQLFPSPAVAGQPVWQWDGEKWSGGPAFADGAVRYDTAQALTAAQMLQARQNIIAAPIEAIGHSDICVNGNMEVTQERAFDTSVNCPNANVYLADQWLFTRNSASAVMAGQNFTLSSIDGFQHGIGVVASTAMGAPASTDYAIFMQPIEGFRWSKLSYGLSWAKPVSIGFFVFPTVSGTMHVAVRNAAGTRSYTVPVAITANTWNYRTVTIPGDVTGTWDKLNTFAASIAFVFACGTSFQTASPNAWVATNTFSTSAQTNFFAGTNSQVYVTGITAVPGNEPVTQERSPYAFKAWPLSLVECQRYYIKVIHSLEFHAVAALSRHTRVVPFPVSMRTNATRIRLTVGSSTNIRGSDPATYFTASPLDNQTWLQSAEAGAAGMCICNGFVEQYSARMM